MRILLALALALSTLAATGCESEPPSRDADESALHAFESQSPDTLRATYDTLPIAERARLWRGHFARALQRPDLDAAQRTALVELSARAEDLLTRGMTEAESARYEDLFDLAQRGEILERLGATRPAAASPDQPDDPAGLVPVACDTRWCSCCSCCAPPCNGDESGWTCEGGGCSSTSSGCGTFWLQGCTKRCNYNGAPM